MKKFISLLAAMALSFASVTAFAAGAAETDNIHVKFVADKATIAPGEDVTISAFVSANGTAAVSFDTCAMFGLLFDESNFTVKEMKGTGFDVGDYSEDYGYGYIWALDESANEHAADVACVEVTFTANAEAAEATYDFAVEADSAETGFAHGLFVYDADTQNVTLTGATVEVKASQPEPPVEDKVIVTENADGTYSVSGEEATLPADAKILIYTEEKADAAALTEASRFVATYNNADSKAYNIYAAVNAEGEGTLNGKTIVFGIIYSGDLNADLFTFDIK